MIDVRADRFGLGVYARQPLAPGQVILRGWGTVIPHRTRHSIQIDFYHHVVIDSPIQLINHSCEPNCGLLIRRGIESVEVHALRPIAVGEELTWDYATTESAIDFMDGPCLCGSPSCRGRVTGYSDLSPETRRAFGPYIAEHLRELDHAHMAG
jgi:SET domain-containing protein